MIAQAGWGSWFGVPARFLSALVLLLLVALWIVLWLRRRRDRCLEVLREFPVEAELRDGSRVGGRLRVFGTGLVLRPAGPFSPAARSPRAGGTTRAEGSPVAGGRPAGGRGPRATILYREEWGRLRSLSCAPDDLEESDRRQWNRRLRGMLGRGGFGREAWLRRIRGPLAALDAITSRRDRAGTPSGEALRLPPASRVPPPTFAHFDPLLETLRGAAVAVERFDPEAKTAIQGILMEYSADFLLLGGVKVSGEEVISVPMSGRKTVPGLAEAHREGARVTLRSLARETIEILRVESYTYLVPIGRAVEPGRTVLLELKNAQIPLLSLVLRIQRDVALVLPRSSARIRESEVGAPQGWQALLLGAPSSRGVSPLARGTPGGASSIEFSAGARRAAGLPPPAASSSSAGSIPPPEAKGPPPALPPATRGERSHPR